MRVHRAVKGHLLHLSDFVDKVTELDSAAPRWGWGAASLLLPNEEAG